MPQPFLGGVPTSLDTPSCWKIPFKIKPYILGLFIITPEIFGGVLQPLPAVPLCVQEFWAQLRVSSHHREFSPGVLCVSSFLNFPSQSFTCAGLDPRDGTAAPSLPRQLEQQTSEGVENGSVLENGFNWEQQHPLSQPHLLHIPSSQGEGCNSWVRSWNNPLLQVLSTLLAFYNC